MNHVWKAAFLLLISMSAGAQTVDGRSVATPELLVARGERGDPITVGIRFALERDWYLYWKNPGDSGLPVEVRWELPEGWTASPLRFPVPQKFVYDNLVSYGYKKEVIFLATITPGRVPLTTLKAELDWLVCKESCIRGSARVASPLFRWDKNMQEVLVRSLALLPRPSKDLQVVVGNPRVQKSGATWEAIVELTGPDAPRVTDFYPEPSDRFFVDNSSIKIENGILRFRFELQKTDSRTLNVSGLFIANSKGYEHIFPIHLSSL
jgi:DsbC/DsbD-like thiol-disulfide interchange protein